MHDTLDTLLWLGVIGAVFAIPGCSDDIAPAAEPDAAGPAARVTTDRQPDGTYVTRIDATSPTDWIHVDLETGGEVADTGPWDIAAQRFHLQLNGGFSGGAGVRVAPMAGADLSSVTEAPAEGWITDAADGPDDNDVPDYAFEQGDGWYGYDLATHVLTPRPIVWVLETGDRAQLALRIESYYDDAGTSGYLRLHWAPLATGGGS
jgi:hypothetical protein